MEKYILVLAIVLIFVIFLNLSAVAAQEPSALMEECKVQEKATDDDVKSMRDPSQPKTKVAKCVLTCLGEKTNKIVNNKLNPDGVLNSIKSKPLPANYSEQLQQSVNEVLAECKNVEDPDRCESGAKIMDCLMEGAIERGIREAFHCGPLAWIDYKNKLKS